MQEYLSLILAALSAFVGALTGIAILGWWLRGQFNNVYRKIAEHETKDVERFHELKMQLLENKIQMQTIEAVKPRRPQ